MQGYILNLNRVNEEDLIVSILTPVGMENFYRFYGLKHSKIQVGFKLDFEGAYSRNFPLRILRNTIHLSFDWIFDYKKLNLFRGFCSLLYKHLFGLSFNDPFYFSMLEDISKKLKKEAPKRVFVEAYLNLLSYEGRLYKEKKCFVCEKSLTNRAILTRGYLLGCNSCIRGIEFDLKKILKLFELKNTIFLDDKEVEYFFNILQEGL